MKKDKRGYYRVTFTQDGRRFSVYGKTEREAILKAEQKKTAAAAGMIGDNATVSAWAERWMKTYIEPKVRQPGAPKAPGTMGPKNLLMYRQMLNNYIIPELGHYKLSKIRDTHLQMLLNDCAGMSKSHVTKLRIVIQAIFSQAHRSRLIPFDPSDGLRLPNYTETRRRSLTADEREKVLASCEATGGLLALFLLRTGLRPAEARSIRWRDVDGSRRLVHVWQSVEAGTDEVGEPKSAAGTRYVPIPADLAARLEKGRGDPFGLVFPRGDGEMMTVDDFRTWWQRFRQTAGLTAPDLTAYCLRHTYCTDLQLAGVDVGTAKYLMGHADIQVTASIYQHPGEATAVGVLQLLDGKDGCATRCATNETKTPETRAE